MGGGAEPKGTNWNLREGDEGTRWTAFGPTRWWAFIFKRIYKSYEPGTIRVVGPLIPLVEDKTVLLKNVN